MPAPGQNARHGPIACEARDTLGRLNRLPQVKRSVRRVRHKDRTTSGLPSKTRQILRLDQWIPAHRRDTGPAPCRRPAPGWAECPLTTTGQPAAIAAAISAPITETARDKFDWTAAPYATQVSVTAGARAIALSSVPLTDQTHHGKDGFLAVDFSNLIAMRLDLPGKAAQGLRAHLTRGAATLANRPPASTHVRSTTSGPPMAKSRLGPNVDCEAKMTSPATKAPEL